MAYRKVGIVAVMDTAQFLPNVSKFLSSIDKMNKAVTESAASTGALAAPIGGVGKAFGALSLVASALITSQVFKKIADGIWGVAKQAGAAAAEFQLLEQRFKTLAARDYMRTTGASIEESLNATSNAAKGTLDWLRNLSVTSPYTVENLAKFYTFAQAAGFSDAAVKRLAKTVGDFSAGMGLTSEHVDRIIWNFSQMKSAGRVLGRELRDLANSMVPVDYIITKLALEFDVTKETMKEMLQSGEVNADKFINTFNEMSETEFEDAMLRLSGTFVVAKANIKDFIDTMIGLDIIKPTLDEIGKILFNVFQMLLSNDARRASVQLGLALKESFLTVADVLREVFFPAMRQLASALGIAKPSADSMSRALLNLGFGFKFIITITSAVIRKVAQFIDAIRGPIEEDLTEAAEDSFGWGANLVIQFARGMASAIGFILRALTAVANTITNWLSPGSPPKLLPDIDEWGAGAMTAYLEGFSNADFSVFDDIAGMIEKYVGAFSDLSAFDAGSLILGGTESLASVISQYEDLSQVPVEVIESIAAAAGIANETMTNYIGSLFQLAEITEDAAQADKIFDFELGQLNTGLANVVDTLDEARAAALAYQGVGSAAIVAYVDALTDLDAASAASTAAQKELNDVTEYYDAILAGLNAQQNKLNDDLENANRLKVIDKTLASVILTADERERLELEKRGILLKREIRDTELAKDAAVDSAQDKVDLAQAAMDIAKENADLQKQLAQDILKATEEQVQGQVDAYQHLLDVMIKNKNTIDDMNKKETGGAGGTDIPEGIFDAGAGAADVNYDDITAGVGEAIDKLKAELKKKWDAFTAEIKKPFQDLESAILTAENALQIFRVVTWPKLQKYIEEHPIRFTLATLGVIGLGIGLRALGLLALSKIREWLTVTVPAWILLNLKKIPAAIAGGLRALWLDISTRVGVFFLELGPKIAQWMIPAGGTIVALLSGFLLLGVRTLVQTIEKYGPEAWNTILTLGDIFRTSLTIAANDISAWSTQATKDVNEWMTKTVGDFNQWADETGAKIGAWVTQASEDITNWVTTAGDNINTWVTDRIDDFETWRKDTGKKISDWASETGTTIGTWITDKAQKISTWVTDRVDDFETWRRDAGKKISDWATKAGTDITNWVTNAGTDITDWVDTAGTDIADWATEAGTNISTWATDAATDISTWVTDSGATISGWVSTAATKFAEFFADGGGASQLIDDFVTFGGNLIGGIIDGLWDRASDLWDTVRGIISDALSAGEDEADISSPSKETYKQGEMWVEGMLAGITDSAHILVDEGGDIIAQAVNKLATSAKVASPSDEFYYQGKMWMLGLQNGIKDNMEPIYSLMNDLVSSAMQQSAELNLARIMKARSTSLAFSSSAAVPTRTTNYSQVINLHMNPTYENVQSPSSIYYDMTAALASVRR